MKKYQIAIAGSTDYTKQVTETVFSAKNFEITWIMTPAPRKIGRKQALTENPLHQFAKENKIETFLIDKKIKKEELEAKLKEKQIDFLLVVDFGYYVPNWLLDLPTIAPLNIHPSWLPRWRGSSPGQMALLFQDFDKQWKGSAIGGRKTAVTLMEMNQKLDQGPIIHQEFFEISDNWGQKEYYDAAFDLICQKLNQTIEAFIKKEIKKEYQPEKSNSPLASSVRKNDLFVDWQYLEELMSESSKKVDIKKSENLIEKILADESFCTNKEDQVNFVNNASKAFSLWPNLWTIVPSKKGEKRMKIISSHIENKSLVLDQVQVEGKNICQWNSLRSFFVVSS